MFPPATHRDRRQKLIDGLERYMQSKGKEDCAQSLNQLTGQRDPI